MDLQTIQAYDANSAAFSQDWEEKQAPPEDLQKAVKTYFRLGPTVDVGCGSGRDAAWLKLEGYDVVGVDASPELLREARYRHASVRFELDTLPKLGKLETYHYVNVLCETVIMHFLEQHALEAVERLVELLANRGTLYLSWRINKGRSYRDDWGRLYANLKPESVREVLSELEPLLDESLVSASSGNVVHRIIACRH